MNPRLFKSALAVFFVLGLGAPIVFSYAGKTANDFYDAGVYLAGAIVFWLWLRADARGKGVPRSWALLVGAAWLALSLVAGSAYLLVTRGLRAGGVAVLCMLGIALLAGAVLIAGALLSAGLMNLLGAP